MESRNAVVVCDLCAGYLRELFPEQAATDADLCTLLAAAGLRLTHDELRESLDSDPRFKRRSFAPRGEGLLAWYLVEQSPPPSPPVGARQALWTIVDASGAWRWLLECYPEDFPDDVAPFPIVAVRVSPGTRARLDLAIARLARETCPEHGEPHGGQFLRNGDVYRVHACCLPFIAAIARAFDIQPSARSGRTL